MGTAYTLLYDLTTLTITLRGGHGPLKLSVRTEAGADTGAAIRLTVTAFVSGSAGPPIG
jgi:hypothetical protein